MVGEFDKVLNGHFQPKIANVNMDRLANVILDDQLCQVVVLVILNEPTPAQIYSSSYNLRSYV